MLAFPLLAASLALTAAPPCAPSAPRALQAADQPIGSAGAFADRTDSFAQLAADARAAVDAGQAELILSSTAFTPEPAPAAAPRADLAWRLGPLPATAGPAPGLAGQTTQQIGNQQGVALMWRHEIDGSATLNNAIRVSHASGPVDTQLAVFGRLSLMQGGPMALSYRSSTSIAVLPFLTVGADAHGQLGTLSAIRAGAIDSVIEPHLKFTLPVLGAVAGATTGWRVPTRTAAGNDPDKRNEFHWRVTFVKKL